MESARTEKFNYSAPSSPRDKSLDLEKYRIDMYSEGEREQDINDFKQFY